MKSYRTKKEAESDLGKFGFFHDKAHDSIIGDADYLCGFSLFHERQFLEEYFIKNLGYFTIKFRPKGLEFIYFRVMSATFRLGLKFSELYYVKIETRSQIQNDKQNSPVYKATLSERMNARVFHILDCLLDNSPPVEGSVPQNVLTICYLDDEKKERYLLFSIKDKYRSKISNLFEKHAPHDFILPYVENKEDVLEKPEKKTPKDKPQSSIADEILKLKQLCDEGIITEDEFILAKKKLLE